MLSTPASTGHRQRQIAALGPCLPGSLIKRTTRCGSLRCRCHHDPSQLHGPYPSWIRKVGTKTITRTLTPHKPSSTVPCSTRPGALAS